MTQEEMEENVKWLEFTVIDLIYKMNMIKKQLVKDTLKQKVKRRRKRSEDEIKYCRKCGKALFYLDHYCSKEDLNGRSKE